MFDPNDSRGPRGQTPHSGAGDLAIFGALPTAFAQTPLRAGDATIAAKAASFTVGPTHASSSPGQAVTTAPDITATGSGGLLAAPIALAGAIIAPLMFATNADDGVTVEPLPIGASGVATFVPAPAGDRWAGEQGSSDAQLGRSEPPAATSAPPLAVAFAMPPANAIETVLASVAALQTAMSALAEALPTAKPPVESAQAAIDFSLQQAQAVAATTLADVTALTEAATANVATAISDLVPVASVATLVAPITASVAAISDTVTAQVAVVSALVPDLGAPIGSLAASAIASVASVTDALGGSDPVAGITTLVGMVRAADAFDIEVPGPSSDGLAGALGAFGAADLLASDGLADVVPADALLGIVKSDNGLLDKLDLDDGVFGL